MNRKIWLSGSAIALALAVQIGAADPASAQAPLQTSAQTPDQTTVPVQTPQDDSSTTVDEVVVTGIRNSLATAIGQKRAADSIVDSISAEDIGAFPDTNIAESLQRVTGVQITRNRGEGQDVSIRGLEPKFARVLLNGDGITSLSSSGINTVGTAGQSRSFDFTILASDFISSLQVYKAPTADLDEGGMAGTIDIRTLRPLDLQGRRLSLSAEGTDNSYVDDTAYKYTGVYADQFLDGRFGVMLGYDKSKRYVDTQSFQGGGMERKIESAYLYPGTTPSRMDFNFDGDTNDAYRLSHLIWYQNDRGTRERESVIGSLQWRPIENLTFRLDGLRSVFESDISADFESAQFHLNSDPSIPGNPVVADHISDIRPFPGDVSNNAGATPIAGLIDYIDRNGVFLSNTNKLAQEESRLNTYSLSADYETGPFRLAAQATHSDTRKVSSNYGMDAQRWGNVSQDYRGDIGGIPSFAYMRGTDPLNPNQWFIPNQALVGTAVDTPVESQADILSADLVYDTGQSFLTAVRIGVKAADTSLEQGDRRLNVTAAQFAAITGDTVIPNAFNAGPGIVAAPYLALFGGPDFLSRYNGPSVFPRTYLAPDIRTFLATHDINTFLAIPGAVTTNLSSTYKIEEETRAAYVRADYSLFDGDLSGNFGLRVVRTQQASSGFSLDTSNLVVVGTVLQSSTGTPLSASRAYTDFLPSFNGRYDIDATKLIRFSASRTLTRPDLTRIVPSSQISYVARTLTTSNPGLDPYRAWNYDLSFEWYPNREAQVSAAFFYKAIEGYLVNATDSVSLAVRDSTTNVVQNIDFARTRPVNGSDTSVKGVELTYQQPLTMLPAPFDGLGVLLNYTYTEPGTIQLASGGPELPLTSVSKHSYNAVAYYERGPLSARVAYNYRSSYVEDPLGSRLDGIYVKPIGQLDASIKYEVIPGLTLAVDGSNLTDEPIERINQYGFGRGYEVNGRNVALSVRFALN